MKAIEAVHLAAGRCLEIAQQLETAVATALLAADGIRSGVPDDIRDEKYAKLVQGLDKITLGRALNELESRLPTLRGSAHILEIALEARNHLAHTVFSGAPLQQLKEQELVEMLAELDLLELDLLGGKRTAEQLAAALVTESIDLMVRNQMSGWPESDAA